MCTCSWLPALSSVHQPFCHCMLPRTLSRCMLMHPILPAACCAHREHLGNALVPQALPVLELSQSALLRVACDVAIFVDERIPMHDLNKDHPFANIKGVSRECLCFLSTRITCSPRVCGGGALMPPPGSEQHANSSTATFSRTT